MASIVDSYSECCPATSYLCRAWYESAVLRAEGWRARLSQSLCLDGWPGFNSGFDMRVHGENNTARDSAEVERQGVPQVRRWRRNLGLGVDFFSLRRDQLLQGQSPGCFTKRRVTGLACM